MTDQWARFIAHRLSKSADKVFLIDCPTGERLTYAQVGARAAGIASLLHRNGIKQGDRIGISLPNGLDFVLIYFACLLGGFTAVPLNNALADKDLGFILQRLQLTLLVAQGGQRNSLPSMATNAKLVDPKSLTEHPPMGTAGIADLLDGFDSSRPLSIHFTSGTTNLPKGVVHSASSLLGNSDAFNRTFGVTGTRTFLHVMPMGYMAGFLNTLLVPFSAGATVALAPQFGPRTVSHFWDVAIRANADFIWVSPSMLGVLNAIDRNAAAPSYCLDRGVQIFSATAPLPKKIGEEFQQKYNSFVIESYGLSELLLISANAPSVGAKPGSVGTVLPEAAVEIRAADGSTVPTGSEGRLFIRTPHAALGYVDYDRGDISAFPDRWFDTGDIAFRDSDGHLFITGREKDIIIRGGFNLSPRLIEETLLGHDAVEQVAVIGVPHVLYGEQVVAAVVLRSSDKAVHIEQDLQAFCRKELGPQMVPDRFVLMNELPASVTGKIMKHRLRRQVEGIGGGSHD